MIEGTTVQDTRQDQGLKSTVGLLPYLFFNGQCEAAFKFYEQNLGGHINAMMTAEGTPMAAETPPEWHHKIMHACMTVGGQDLQGSDCRPEYYEAPQGFCVQLSVETPAKAERLFHILADGGRVTMPLEQTFWAARFGMLVDQFGTPWMINCSNDGPQGN